MPESGPGSIVGSPASTAAPPQPTGPLVIVVLGASGDLAYKKTFPALFALHSLGYLGDNIRIIGYARSKLDHDRFITQISQRFQRSASATLDEFLGVCSYVSGQYDKPEDFQRLDAAIREAERAVDSTTRIFYMALPPSVFACSSEMIKRYAYLEGGINRLIVEKPFGRDLESSRKLGAHLSRFFSEEEIFRIDHYLGKEMVKNLMVLRFANVIIGAIFNRFYIDNIQITFKETIGTEGRGGYFDEFGVIRDVMQNHLMQILSIIAMECPVSRAAEDIRDEKVKVLRSIQPLTLNDVIVGQYTRSADGKIPGYTEDEGVPKDSITPTYAVAVFNINNERWDGVPFIVKCGKALDQQKAEIRIQFKDVSGNIYDTSTRNELVIRLQPKEAVYMKIMSKRPGLSDNAVTTELDLSYGNRYKDVRIPDAYEALILDAVRGEKTNFVRTDELDAAWKIFTPLLQELESKHIKPQPYEFGTRGPKVADDFIRHNGYRYDPSYEWSTPKI